MQYHKRDLGGELKFDDYHLSWEIHREPQFCERDGYKGVSIAVADAERPQKTLLLEYPYVHSIARHHRRPKPNEARLITHIKAAIEAGYDPFSRGKPFAFQVSENA